MLQLSRRAPAIFAATLALLSFTHAPMGQAAQIDVILGGASVIGTECVNGKVEVGESMAVGPNQTLYVKTASSTKLRRNVLGAAWGQDDKIKFKDLVGNSVLQQVQSIFNYGNGEDETALFGRAGEAEFSIPQGQGRYQMLYTSGNAATDLGTMYTAESVYVDGKWGDYYSCEPPLPESPGRPVIEEVVAGDQSALVYLDEPAGAGGPVEQYKYTVCPSQNTGECQAQKRSVTTSDGSSPILVDQYGSAPLTNGTAYVVTVTAIDAGCGSSDQGSCPESDYSDDFTPSASAPPLPDAPTITGVTAGNGTGTINFTAPSDNGVAITNYAYRLTREFDYQGDFITLNPASTASSIPLIDLNNGETYTVSIAAINANGMGLDSNEKSFTPGTQCKDVIDWTAPQDPSAYFCSVELTDYDYADFHILTTTGGADVCLDPDSFLPTGENSGQGLFCAQDGATVRAIYDWDNGQDEYNAKHQLTWLASVQQIGSRSKEPSNDACGALGTTVAGRCANQLKIGEDAFRGMAGAGGSAIENLDTSNLDNIEHIFQDASQFNQNVSTKQVTVNNVTYIAWDISGVDRINSAFWGATNFNNGGQPLYWDTGSVWNMGWSFAESSFDQNINTQQVTIGNSAFTAWDTSSVQFFDNMFNGATAFDQDVSGWVTTAGANMSSMFYGVSSFNQDLSSWNVTSVTNRSNFDEGASAWCGTAFDNRGRPSDWEPSLAAGCPADVENFVSLEAPASAVAGDELTYSLAYWNSSNAATNGNTLVLTLPTDVTLPADA
ncbi:MAG: BspA family leucine-rich repeat surface protein, partial [Pseudomonadales bacterium]|nr:BspA family leucine-rich repeat surface protein [Pseudomonadales bacterium]